jgi:hydroxymethylglutaryl-CoA lyase
VPASEAIAIGKWWRDIGASYIGFGDTTGVANPKQVSHFYAAVLDAGLPKDRLVAHFHDTRGWGMVNTLTALSFGLSFADGSLGAIGGQPKTGAADYHRGFTGNTCTEDLVGMLEEMGVHTGIDVPALLALGARAESVLGRRLRSNFLQAGPVPHAGIVYDKQRGIAGAAGSPSLSS